MSRHRSQQRRQPGLIDLVAARAKPWQIIVGLVLALIGLGGSITYFERQFGVIAQLMGFLRLSDMFTHKKEHKQVTDEIASDVLEIQIWQHFNNVKKLERELEDYESLIAQKSVKSGRDRDRVRDLKEQIRQTQAEYEEKLKKRRDRAVPSQVPVQ